MQAMNSPTGKVQKNTGNLWAELAVRAVLGWAVGAALVYFRDIPPMPVLLLTSVAMTASTVRRLCA